MDGLRGGWQFGWGAGKVVPRETTVSLTLPCVFHVEHTKPELALDAPTRVVVSRETR